MATGSVVGVKLGAAIAHLGAKVREESLARTTPALVNAAAKVVDAEAGRRATAAQQRLIGWFESRGVPVRPDGELAGLFGAIARAGGWMMQQSLSTAIGFGIGGAMTVVLEPFFADMAQAAWRVNPAQLLSPDQLATLAARGWIETDRLHDEAQSSGLTAERADLVRRLAETPLPVVEILELVRRGVIDEAEADRRLHHAGFGDDGRAALLELRTVIPTIEEALQGLLEGQIDEATARRRYLAAGGDPTWFEDAFHIRGEAPTPTQALELLNRGIIAERGSGPDATTYEQAFLEGPWRNKWLDPFLALRTYIVPPRSVVPMVRSGAWDAARGVQELVKSGVPPDVAQAMLDEASAGKLATERDLVKSEILAAYGSGILKADETRSALEGLGYDPDEAELLLAIADHAWERRFRDAVIGRISTLYRTRRIDEEEAQAALGRVGVAGSASAKYLAIWDVERETPSADLTEAEIRKAWGKGLVDEDYYRTWLLGHGFTEDEATLKLDIWRPAAPAAG